MTLLVLFDGTTAHKIVVMHPLVFLFGVFTGLFAVDNKSALLYNK